MKTLIEFFIKRPLLVNLISVLILLVGLLTLSGLNRATYPKVNFDIMKVTTEYPGASAEDVEINVTRKIEKELGSVQGIDYIKSISLENISTLYVFIDLNYKDTQIVKDDIRDAVERVTELPEEVTKRPYIDELKSSNVAVIELAVSMEKLSEEQAREVAKDLEEQIEGITGVAQVELVSYRKREVKILADPDKLKEHYISLLDLFNAIKNRNIHTSGGTLTSIHVNKKVVTYSEFETPEEVGDVILRSNATGNQVKIHQIAQIKNQFEKHQVITRTNGFDSINLLVKSDSDSDVINISEKIKEFIAQQKKSLGDKIDIKVVSDFSYYTRSLLNIVTNNALIGIVLVLISLMIFLSHYTALWTAFGIPLSVLGAVIFFPLYDVSINFISMISMILVLGLLVDDAIVVAENVTRHVEMGKDKVQAALHGAYEMFWPVCTTIITTILAFVPMFFMKGVTGKFITQIPLIIILTLLFSLVESTLILPSHLAHSKNLLPRKLEWFEKIKRSYAKLIKILLKVRGLTLLGFMGLLVAAAMLFHFKMKRVLFPFDDVDIFYVIAELPQGTPQDITSERMREVERIVDKIPRTEMVNYTTTIGHHTTNVYGGGNGLHENFAKITVYLKHASDRARNSRSIMDEVDVDLEKIKGFDKLYSEPFNDGPPVGKPITITVVSKKDEQRQEFANRIFKYLQSVKGVSGLEIDFLKGKKEVRIRPDHAEMARLGITSKQVALTLRAAFQGVVPTSIVRSGEEIDFRVQLDTSSITSEEIIGKLQVPNMRGQLIDLSRFTKMESRDSFEQVRHYNHNRSITVMGDVDTDIISSTEANKLVMDKFMAEAKSTPGLQLIFGGEEKATQESFESFYVAFGCALIAIYFVLIVLFESLILPFLIMLAIPFGLAGVIIVFFLHGLPVSFLCMIGCIGLLGIIVNDSLIMVSHYNNLSKTEPLTMDLIARGACDRFRAVMLTTITTVAGMIPTVYGFGGSEPFIVPIVLAVAGGLIFATTITLLLIPILYSFKVPKEITL